MSKETTVWRLMQVLTIVLVIQSSVCWAADESSKKISTFLSNAAEKVGGPKHIGTTITKNWSDNPEVKEIADLKRALNSKKTYFDYGNYLQWQKIRADKLSRIFYTDQDWLTEYISLIRNEEAQGDSIAHEFANKTFISSLINACVQYKDICAKL